jgi:hypothetical protein
MVDLPVPESRLSTLATDPEQSVGTRSTIHLVYFGLLRLVVSYRAGSEHASDQNKY